MRQGGEPDGDHADADDRPIAVAEVREALDIGTSQQRFACWRLPADPFFVEPAVVPLRKGSIFQQRSALEPRKRREKRQQGSDHYQRENDWKRHKLWTVLK